MGSTWSVIEPAEDMRLASRDVCDDETWANTVNNRSACSVQERLSLLAWEIFPLETLGFLARERSERKLEFAKHDMVCVFEKDDVEDLPPDEFNDGQDEHDALYSDSRYMQYIDSEDEHPQCHRQQLLHKYSSSFTDSDSDDSSPSSSLDNW